MLPLRTYIETARDRTGRVATAAGATALTYGLLDGDLTGVTMLGTVAATGAGLAASTSGGEHGDTERAVARALYASPGAGLLAVLVTERVTEGFWWEAASVAAVAVWTAGVWVLRPARLARRLLGRGVAPAPAPLPTETTLDVVEQAAEAHPMAQWWAQKVACDIAPQTRLESPERTGPQSMRGIIASTVPGEPVPDISIPRLSARMNVPKELISIGALPGHGAGLLLLTIGAAPAPATPEQEWARIADAALPGTSLLEFTTYPTEKEVELS